MTSRLVNCSTDFHSLNQDETPPPLSPRAQLSVLRVWSHKQHTPVFGSRRRHFQFGPEIPRHLNHVLASQPQAPNLQVFFRRLKPNTRLNHSPATGFFSPSQAQHSIQPWDSPSVPEPVVVQGEPSSSGKVYAVYRGRDVGVFREWYDL